MATDCYLILGVPRDASISRIRRAFMRFCHEHDPDRHLTEARFPFDTVCDAYETLVNRERRFHHDLSLAHADLSERYPAPLSDEPVDLIHSFESHQPTREEIEDQFARNFTGRGVPKSHPVRELTVELAISPDAATRGGRLPIDVPVARLCERCEGSGSTGFAPCDDCDARGLFWDTARVDVLLSPQARDGTIVPVSLRHLGIDNLYLRVLVRVAPQTIDA